MGTKILNFVKPVCNNDPYDTTVVVFVDRWSLYLYAMKMKFLSPK
jgi:hypothetical protein